MGLWDFESVGVLVCGTMGVWEYHLFTVEIELWLSVAEAMAVAILQFSTASSTIGKTPVHISCISWAP